MTTVRHPLKELLGTAVGLLIGRIEGTRTGPPAHIVVPTELVIRGSTAKHRFHDTRITRTKGANDVA